MSDISLFGLGKPAKVLVEKVANAFGRHFDSSQTVRMAEAEARAYHILEINKAETDLEGADLRRRAAARLINEEMTNQSNIENITEKATHYLNDDATPEVIEDDWIRNCIDKGKMVSDDGMQDWWARILAGEANNPGSFSRRTVNLVADLEKGDAELFRSFCSFVWMSEDSPWPFVFDTHHQVYNQQSISFSSIGHLDSLGLVRFNDLDGFVFQDVVKRVGLSYHGKLVILAFPNDAGNKLDLGKVLFTQSGRELSRICEASPAEGFFEYVYDRWANESLVPPRVP